MAPSDPFDRVIVAFLFQHCIVVVQTFSIVSMSALTLFRRVAVIVVLGIGVGTHSLTAQGLDGLFFEEVAPDGKTYFTTSVAGTGFTILPASIIGLARGITDTTMHVTLRTKINGMDSSARLHGEDPIAVPIRVYSEQRPEGYEIQAYRRLVWSTPGDSITMSATLRAGRLDMAINEQNTSGAALEIQDNPEIRRLGLDPVRMTPVLSDLTSQTFLYESDPPVIISDPRIAFAGYFGMVEVVEIDPIGNIVFIASAYFTPPPLFDSVPPTLHDSLIKHLLSCNLVKMNSRGDVIWASRVPGDFRLARMAFDSHYNVLIGTSMSSHLRFPKTAGRFQEENREGYSDGLIIKITDDGALDWATYLGGSGNDYVHTLVLDKDDNIYCAVLTNSSNYPVSGDFPSYDVRGKPSGYDRYDAAVSSLTPDGRTLRWSTYWSGKDTSSYQTPDIHLYVTGMVYDGQDRIILCLTQGSIEQLPVTPDAWQTEQLGKRDGLLTCFKTYGDVEWSTLISTPHPDYLTHLAMDDDSTIIILHHVDSEDTYRAPAIGVPEHSATPLGHETFVLRFNLRGRPVYLWAPIEQTFVRNFYPLGNGQYVVDPVVSGAKLSTPDSFTFQHSWVRHVPRAMVPQIAVVNHDWSPFFVSPLGGDMGTGSEPMIRTGAGYIMYLSRTYNRGAVATDTAWGAASGTGYDPLTPQSWFHVVLLKPSLTSIAEREVSGFDAAISIFPNPAEGTVKLHTTAAIMDAALISLQGQVVATFIAHGTDTELDTSSFPPGYYFVRCRTIDGMAVKPIVLMH